MPFDGTVQVLGQAVSCKSSPAHVHLLLVVSADGCSAIRPSPLTNSDTYAGGT